MCVNEIRAWCKNILFLLRIFFYFFAFAFVSMPSWTEWKQKVAMLNGYLTGMSILLYI
jgi:hypothetical protein